MLRESSSIRHHPAYLLPVHSMQQTMPTVLCSHVQKNARSLEQHSESSHSELRKNHTGTCTVDTKADFCIRNASGWTIKKQRATALVGVGHVT